ncbi:hypothetical protein EW146_g3758 [Bondarzewia mesenterica]|uniref:PX domain-containing protein n=1 Tax=Bondarzewia mesenterica TaxID=1095465 RepID=A0A4S4LXU7_9AGAM|nr:hypothetical protein EW146_g3758 [Bondarzewia mesenterica]
MDGFDDLLKQSSRALEENPFEDPFAKPRSSSPDPWYSYLHRSTHLPNHEFESSAAAFDEAESNTPPTELLGHGEPSELHEPSTTEPVASDPLDLANVNLSEEEPEKIESTIRFTQPSAFRESVESEPPTPSPAGFRESVGQDHEPEPDTSSVSIPISNISTASPPSPESPSTPPVRTASPTFASPTSPTQPTSARLPQRQTSYHSSTFSPQSQLSTPKNEPQRIVHSPLEQPQSSLDRSFASLALGGESFSGWEGSQSAFVGSPTTKGVQQQDDEDDEDDNKPLRPRPVTSVPTSPKQSEPPKQSRGLQPEFVISVDDPQKVGDPIRGYTMYTVHTRTTSPLFSKSTFSVLRRYSDFLWLYETLSLNNPGVVVPPVPEKNPFGRFAGQFVAQRRLALQNCIMKTANHPVLGKDADLRLFLESDSFALDIKHRKAEQQQERGGLMATIGQSITGPRFVETDEWFDRQKAYLDTLELQLRGLVKAIDIASKHRTELATAVGEFTQTITDLTASDLGSSLMGSLAALADVEKKAQELEAEQAQQDLVTFLGTADEYARLISSVRMAFSSRVRMYYAWQNADSDLRRVRANHERNRAQGRIPSDRLGHSLSQVADAERRTLDAKQEFDQVSKLVKSEVARFEQERIEDFKNSLERFLDGMISRQKELIEAQENYQRLLMKRLPASGQILNGSMTTVA